MYGQATQIRSVLVVYVGSGVVYGVEGVVLVFVFRFRVCIMGDRLAQDETDRNIEIWKIKRVR